MCESGVLATNLNWAGIPEQPGALLGIVLHGRSPSDGTSAGRRTGDVLSQFHQFLKGLLHPRPPAVLDDTYLRHGETS